MHYAHGVVQFFTFLKEEYSAFADCACVTSYRKTEALQVSRNYKKKDEQAPCKQSSRIRSSGVKHQFVFVDFQPRSRFRCSAHPERWKKKGALFGRLFGIATTYRDVPSIARKLLHFVVVIAFWVNACTLLFLLYTNST